MGETVRNGEHKGTGLALYMAYQCTKSNENAFVE